ncbi:MAG: acyltransferase [Devosia sp.]|nr:acyltransferase [Devosia sp.]
MSDAAAPATPAHLPYLDGLRGIAAAWVLLGHIGLLAGANYPVLKEGGSAVDLFMILSGFLMAFHYLEREDREPWEEPSTWFRFWTRRFFRIAPLYYLLLALALLGGTWVGQARDVIGGVHPETLTAAVRYTDHSAANWLTHITFVFGLLPRFGYRTALPDWSIGLEMQFYLALPFLMILWKRGGPLAMALAALVVCAAVRVVFPHYVHAFSMPSMLTLKLHVFVAGMLLAGAVQSAGNKRALLQIGGAVAMPLIAALARIENPVASSVQLVLVGLFSSLVFHRALAPRPIVGALVGAAVKGLDAPVMRWLGDTSYSVYLLHLLLAIPLIAMLSSVGQFNQLPGVLRFAISVAICAPPVYFVAGLLHRGIELPGIALGKRALVLAGLHPARRAAAE